MVCYDIKYEHMKTSSGVKVHFHSSTQCLNVPSQLWHYSENPQQQPSHSN